MDEQARVSIAALDSALTHLQEANRRLARLLAMALILIACLLGGLLYFLTNYEVVMSDVSIDSHEGPANYNYIGNDGDIDNGSN
jgi:hypothetical protein